jgi:hypothetical protein
VIVQQEHRHAITHRDIVAGAGGSRPRSRNPP